MQGCYASLLPKPSAFFLHLAIDAMQAGRLRCKLILSPDAAMIPRIARCDDLAAVLSRLSFAVAAAQITAQQAKGGMAVPSSPSSAAGALTILAMDLRGHGQSRTSDDADLSAEVLCWCTLVIPLLCAVLKSPGAPSSCRCSVLCCSLLVHPRHATALDLCLRQVRYCCLQLV